MSQLSTLALARASDAREIAEMSRDLIEQGLTWSWTPARVQHFISGAESSVVVARRQRGGDAPDHARRNDVGRLDTRCIAAFAITPMVAALDAAGGLSCSVRLEKPLCDRIQIAIANITT